MGDVRRRERWHLRGARLSSQVTISLEHLVANSWQFGAYKPSLSIQSWSVDKQGVFRHSLPHGELHERSAQEMEAAVAKEFAQLPAIVALARICVPQLNIQVRLHRFLLMS